ncbi:Stress response kinase A [compost metagenome]
MNVIEQSRFSPFRYFNSCRIGLDKLPQKVNINNENEWNAEFFSRWGSMVGRIHSLTKKYKTKQVNARRPHQYDKDQEFIHTISKKLDDTQTFSLQKFIFLSEVLNPDKKKEHDLYGLVHNDIHTGNFHVLGGELQLFDFDECSYHIPSLLKMREVVLHLFFTTRWNLSELTFKQQKILKDLEFNIKNDIPVLERIF